MLLYYERRRRHLAEREAHQHLLEVTKMDRAMTASAMSASIAHELNQPLSAILNNAETAEMLLTAKSLDREQLKEILADIRRDDYRAVDIIKHLRMLLKQGELDAKNIDLTELLSDTIGLFKPRAAEQGVTVEIVLVPTNLQVRADRVHIQQVLLNLAMNAIDAMQNVPVGKRKLRLQVTRRDNEAVIAIEDTGTGIPEDKLKSIFEPFVTTKQLGTGLGLSIARTIIHTYGGRIWAENRAGNGAMFCFTLSLAKAEAAQATLEV
jgi:C4-dicarboxylate-specific signal transduction histidine kinase